MEVLARSLAGLEVKDDDVSNNEKDDYTLQL